MHLDKGKKEEYGRNEEDVPERTNFRFLKGSLVGPTPKKVEEEYSR
jgi:hypothetical protein